MKFKKRPLKVRLRNRKVRIQNAEVCKKDHWESRVNEITNMAAGRAEAGDWLVGVSEGCGVA